MILTTTDMFVTLKASIAGFVFAKPTRFGVADGCMGGKTVKSARSKEGRLVHTGQLLFTVPATTLYWACVAFEFSILGGLSHVVSASY